MCCRMQSRREYNPFNNALDTSKKPSIKPWYNSSQSGNEDKRRCKNLNYLYLFFFFVAASVHVYYFYFCIVTVFSNFKPWRNDRTMPTQHIPTLLGTTCCVRLTTVLGCVATCWVLLAQVWKWSNLSSNTQHVLIGWPNAHNMLHPTILRYFVLTCCDRLAAAFLSF